MFTRCTGLSKGWWWSLTLLSLALLYFFMLYTKQSLIESDLQSRIRQQLTAEGINATVVLEKRGRDVLLLGSAKTKQERDRVITLAERITGVRVVDNKITVPLPIEPTLVLASKGGKIVLSGVLPSQEQIDELINDASSIYGANNVDNQLTMGRNIASPTWLSDSKLLFPVLNTLDQATLSIATGAPLLSATVYSEAEKNELHQRVQGLLSMPIMEKIVINTTIEPADITARMLNGKLTVEGKLVSQQQIDDMLQLLFEFFDEKNVSNQLIVSQGVTTEKGRLTLSGQVDNMLHIKLRLAAKDIMKSTGFTLKDRLVEKKLSLVGRNDANNIVPKVANTKQQHANNEKAMTACQAELDQVMSGKNIHFASNKAIIKPESVVILDKLVSIISRCKAALSSSEVLISGYTDSKGNARYNTRLSQRRADAVRAYLNKAGIVPTLLKAKGFGEVQPIASNANKEGRARNRRITFSVINKQLVSK